MQEATRHNQVVTITCRIIVRNPVSGAWGAIQEGHGSAGRPFALIQGLSGTTAWDVPVTLKGGKPGGAFVQKDSKGPFVYILWGTSAGQANTCVTRRAKVYLPPDLAEQSEPGDWTVQLDGTGKDGGPACATVRPAAPWRQGL